MLPSLEVDFVPLFKFRDKEKFEFCLNPLNKFFSSKHKTNEDYAHIVLDNLKQSFLQYHFTD